MRRMLIFIAGTKGGVGKSFASAMLAGAAEDLGLSLTVYDTDNENRTLATLMKTHCRFLDERKETYPLDEVINSLYESSPATVTIVDMKAGTSRSTQEWFSSVPWDALRKIDVDVYVAGCVTSDPDSVRTFGPWLEYFHNIDFPVHYLLIKNAKDGDNFFVCDSLLEPGMREMELDYSVFSYHRLSRNTSASSITMTFFCGIICTAKDRKHFCRPSCRNRVCGTIITQSPISSLSFSLPGWRQMTGLNPVRKF